ncbi:MAG TPA: U32 family peptidase [Candidatus Stercoripulliclostridium merdigallinarum]|uniref:U32 family peptidase n=1 Tax=Candidatus Stercoripulliclostridium merdigallinarum TaxID=2840951 RepID=A0A9D1MI32_9FIRM|nr:U32 family peptidase [Candidatus Stercoripulliclostridium merdigallinarum]
MKSELLAPAGSLEKLKVAFLYGADAVYVGGKNFSLRQYADNFTAEELAEGIDYAHERQKKVYVAVNIFAKNADFPEAEKYFKFLERIGADAVLITDPGLIALCKKTAPGLEIHLSTQANTLNKYAVRFWAEQGVKRVVLARELGYEEIKEIAEYNPDVEIECFVHGAMCVSYSGRCLLSNYLSERNANRGECVQACRWRYELTAYGRDGDKLELTEDERGAYILNSRDLNLLKELNKLSEAGVKSFKIEGRMKTVYYLATVVNAYRRAMDGGDLNVSEAELTKINHRAYTKAYFYGENDKTLNYDEGQEQGEYEFAAWVIGYEGGTALVEMRNRFAVGDELEVLSPGDSFLKKFVVGNMTDEDNVPVADAKLVQQRLKIAVPFRLYAGDILRKKC